MPFTSPDMNHRPGVQTLRFLEGMKKGDPEHFWKPLYSLLGEKRREQVLSQIIYLNHLAEGLARSR